MSDGELRFDDWLLTTCSLETLAILCRDLDPSYLRNEEAKTPKKRPLDYSVTDGDLWTPLTPERCESPPQYVQGSLTLEDSFD